MRIALPMLFSVIVVPAILIVPLSDLFSGLGALSLLRFPVLIAAAVLALTLSTAQMRVKRLSILLGAFSGFGLMSAIWSQNPEISLERAFLNIVTASLIICYAMAFPSVSQIRILVACAVAVTVTILFATAYGVIFEFSEAYYQGNFRGGLSNSNVLAHMIVVFAVPLCAAHLSESGIGKKTFWILMMILIVFILVLTRSRAAVLAFSIIAVFFVLTRRQVTVRIAFALFSVIAVVYFSADILEFFMAKYSAVSVNTFGTRSVLWTLHLASIWERPILGYGIGINPVNFKEIDNYERDTEKGSSLISLPQELGIPFFIVFFMFLLWALRGPIRRLISRIRLRQISQLALLPLFVIFGSAVHSIFETWIFNFGNITSLFFWMSIAFVLRSDAELVKASQMARQRVQ